jgi:hypothetical protein
MNLRNILKIYQKANEMHKVEHPASASLFVGSNEIELNVAGQPSVIDITYKGICNINNKLPITYKVNLSKNKITILNIFKKQIPNLLLEYTGKLTIIDCEILTFAGNRFKATINNNELQEIIDGQRTKVEDDTMIIYDEPEKEVKRPFKRALKTHNILSSVENVRKKISGLSKEEKLDLKESVIKTMFNRKILIKPIKEDPVKQEVVKPSPITSPVKTPPIVTTSNVKEEKGKY